MDIYIYIYIYMYIYICVCVCVCVWVSVCMYVCECECACVWVCEYISAISDPLSYSIHTYSSGNIKKKKKNRLYFYTLALLSFVAVFNKNTIYSNNLIQLV